MKVQKSRVLTLPYLYNPREYQIPLLDALDTQYKRAIAVWHRRSGKDKTFFNYTVKKAYERKGWYYYYFPTLQQGRKILWDGMDKEGMKFLDHVPTELITKINNQDMKILFENGSGFQVMGTDRLEVVGPNPVGCVFSEFSLQNPKGWDYSRPILAENNGWGLFNFTPRGMNHAYELYVMAQGNPKWYCEMLTVDQTFFTNQDGKWERSITEEAIQEERDAGMSEELIQQEFYCSFEYGMEGAYFSKMINQARTQGRIMEIPFDPILPVETGWDIGVGDANAIWFFQRQGQSIYFIDYHEAQGEGLPYYIRVIAEKQEERGFNYSHHFAPHDIEARDYSVGIPRIEIARSLGLNFDVIPKIGHKDDAIEMARSVLPRSYFDQERCKDGLAALSNYQKEYNEKLNVFANRPLHNWASHGADAYQTAAAGVLTYGPQSGRMTEQKAREMYERYGPPPTG